MLQTIVFRLALLSTFVLATAHGDPPGAMQLNQDVYQACLTQARSAMVNICATMNVGNTGTNSCDNVPLNDTVIAKCKASSTRATIKDTRNDPAVDADKRPDPSQMASDDSGSEGSTQKINENKRDSGLDHLIQSTPTTGSSGLTSRPRGTTGSGAASNDEPGGDDSAPAKVASKTKTQSGGSSTGDDDSSSGSSGSSTKGSSGSRNSGNDANSQSSNSSSQNGNSNPQNGNSNNSSTNTSSAQSQANQDLMSCQQWQSRAQSCCNSPTACLSDNDKAKIRQLQLIRASANNNDTQGITAACSQMQQTGDDGSSINLSLSAACTSPQYNCSSSCASLQQKYYGLMNSTSTDSPLYSVYSAAYTRASSSRMACDQLQAQGNALASNGLQVDTSAYSSYCSQQAAMSPQSAGGSPSGAAAASATPAASSSANSAAATASTSGFKSERGQAGMLGAENKSGNFDLGSNADQRQSATGAIIQPSRSGQPAQVATVPNGGGGGGMGGGGGGSHAAPTAAGGARAPGSPGYSTDIDRGFRSGGGSLSPNGTPAGYNGMDSNGRDPASVGDSLKGVNLRDFLPGGRKDPALKLAGTVFGSQINLKEEDIWRRISNKFMEKCKLGELLDCH